MIKTTPFEMVFIIRDSMNIRVDLTTPITDGTEVVFRSPVDCSQVTGLIVYYNDDSKEFAFADAHGNNVGDIDHLFAENVVVKVILDVTNSMAFVQNADTNTYLEEQFAKFVKTVNGTEPDENGNVELELPSGGGSSPDGGAFRISMVLTEDVSTVVLKMPVKWEKIVQYNLNCVPKLSGNAKVEMRNGGNYRIIGDLSSGTKAFNIYGIQYWHDMFSQPYFTCGLVVASNAEDTARPMIPAASMGVAPNLDEIVIYTVAAAAVFQAGTKFEMWGVYTP